ncbi:HDOD domain-containing protein [Thiospirochaeta perfilievii]|uniref:HDOD domain-containing protein n=1 Tax=Thiospirochaeta perfilievii TaxID=252967 RepID=A0A5C1QA84_9SPIO|nr:HDOD domain-containing protein [Thiospirochaeta perfilievii]QEN03706.1 HDOD domain-containing protein [Thiospirochaeta perfilievii]
MRKVFYSNFDLENIENIVNSLKGKKEYICTIPFYDSVSEILISKVVYELLNESGFEDFNQAISIIINELLKNSNKINIKNIFFKESNTNLEDIAKSKEADQMFSFKDYYNKFMLNVSDRDKSEYIKIIINIDKDYFNLSILNSGTLLDWQLEEINTSIKYANRFNNLNEIFQDDKDISQNDNFGIIFSTLMLKNINIDSRALDIKRHDGYTDTTLTLPLKRLKDVHGDRVTEEIIKEISVLPQFPDSIMKLQKEIMDPEWNYDRITDYILSDSALTAEILRLVNSPVYRPSSRIDKVSIAVKKIGINGLKAILYNFGSFKVLSSKYDIDKINQYKEHLFQVALISSYLANMVGLDEFSEDIYVAALMHDIGKIIVNALNPELEDGIMKLSKDRMIPTDVIDNLSDGYNHSIIGSKLIEKWNFPKKYIEAIKHHHTPLKVDDEYKIITFCVYLGNQIPQVHGEKRKFSSIENKVLKFFKINTIQDFNNLLTKLENSGIFFT